MKSAKQNNRVRPDRLVRCGKDEFILNLVHMIAIFLILIIGLLTTPAMQFISLFTVFGIYLISAISVRASGPIHLDIVFLFFLFIYSFSVPLSASLSENSFDKEVIWKAAEICLLGYTGFSFGMLLDSGQHRRIAEVGRIDEKSAKLMRKSGMWIFVIGVFASIAAIVLTSGISAYLSAGYAGRALLKRDAGPVELGLYFSIVGLFAVFASTILSDGKQRVSKAFVTLVFLVFFFYISFLGIRRPLFLLGVGLLSGYSLIRHRPKLGIALSIGVISFVFLTTFAQYRQLISSAGVEETIVFIQDNASLEWLDVSNTELGAPFRTLTDHIQGQSINDGLLFGSSYVQTFLYVLPSRITGGLESLSVEYTNRFFSSDFIAIGGNMGLFPVTEAYLNFGRTGVLFLFGIIGFCLARTNRWFHGVGRGKIQYIVVYMTLVPWAAFFMRLDMASVSKGFLYSQIVPFIFVLLFFQLYRQIRNVS